MPTQRSRVRSSGKRESATDRARRSMAAHKAKGGGDKHWRLSPATMTALRYILNRRAEFRTEQALIEWLIQQERQRLSRSTT